MGTFGQLVEMVRELSLCEKEKLLFLLKRHLRETKRDKIYMHFEKSKREYKGKSHVSSSDIRELKKSL